MTPLEELIDLLGDELMHIETLDPYPGEYATRAKYLQAAYDLGLAAGRQEQDQQIAEVCRNCGCQEVGR